METCNCMSVLKSTWRAWGTAWHSWVALLTKGIRNGRKDWQNNISFPEREDAMEILTTPELLRTSHNWATKMPYLALLLWRDVESFLPCWIFLMNSGRTEWPTGKVKTCSQSRRRRLTTWSPAFQWIQCTTEFLQKSGWVLQVGSDGWVSPAEAQIHGETFKH